MKTGLRLAIACFALGVPAALSAQLAVPDIHLPPPPVTDGFPADAGPLIDGLGEVADPALFDRLGTADLQRALTRLRDTRLAEFVRRNRDSVERDRDGNASVRGTVLATGMSADAVQQAQSAGFAVLERETITGLDIDIVRFATPTGSSLKSAQKKLQKLAPDAEISADNIYFTSGTGHRPATPAVALAGGSSSRPMIGLIDGGVAKHPAIGANIEQRGFARGAPTASSHGTAIASLLVGAHTVRGAAAGSSLLVADVYGSDPAGGNASAIARALGWMVQMQVPVVTISLTGPDNALLRKAVATAQAKGVVLVAAIGNDGPAAKLNYPASYRGVIAVTAVDERNRALPEAGRASHVDFAAPGADMIGASIDGETRKLRGTSYAAPFVAARMVRHYPALVPAARSAAISALTAEARRLGKKQRDSVYGAGLLCGGCATR